MTQTPPPIPAKLEERAGAGMFGAGLDALARRVGDWPESHIVHTVEVIGKGDDPQVMLTGSAATFGDDPSRPTYIGPKLIAVVRISEYRAALAREQQA